MLHELQERSHNSCPQMRLSLSLPNISKDFAESKSDYVAGMSLTVDLYTLREDYWTYVTSLDSQLPVKDFYGTITDRVTSEFPTVVLRGTFKKNRCQ